MADLEKSKEWNNMKILQNVPSVFLGLATSLRYALKTLLLFPWATRSMRVGRQHERRPSAEPAGDSGDDLGTRSVERHWELVLRVRRPVNAVVDSMGSPMVYLRIHFSAVHPQQRHDDRSCRPFSAGTWQRGYWLGLWLELAVAPPAAGDAL
ncbi:hypothetical protein EV421DRAFT_1231394 [Armillaria borealis]|uniref:Uncharacterized protein n=1 Tax=Armillaria borealis TaxID=47425 RepID=A0AA39MHZ9_9AGAR|nr:hypothetical protein EV421DRAFT_1231394 [Armillaria borealis]